MYILFIRTLYLERCSEKHSLRCRLCFELWDPKLGLYRSQNHKARGGGQDLSYTCWLQNYPTRTAAEIGLFQDSVCRYLCYKKKKMNGSNKMKQIKLRDLKFEEKINIHLVPTINKSQLG